jgi:hypothetical protein
MDLQDSLKDMCSSIEVLFRPRCYYFKPLPYRSLLGRFKYLNGI